MKKLKLFATIASLCLAIAVLCVGVFSAINVTYTIGGSISYEVQDVFVKITTNVYKVEGSEPKSQSEMKEDIAVLKTKALSGIDTTKYIPSQTNLGVYDSSKEISSSNKNSAEGIDIVYGKDSTGKLYYTYYVVINIENLSSRTDVCAYIEDKTTAEVNSITTTNTYINNISSTNETKNIVIGYSLKDKTQSIDSVAFNYSLTASFDEYVEEEKPVTYTFTKNDDGKTVTLTHYSTTATDSIVNIPKTVSFEIKKNAVQKFSNSDEFMSYFVGISSDFDNYLYMLTYTDSSTNNKVSNFFVGKDSTAVSILTDESKYPVEIDTSSWTLSKTDFETNAKNIQTAIGDVITAGGQVSIICGTKYAKQDFTGSNIADLQNLYSEMTSSTKPSDYDTYFPLQIEMATEQYCEGSDYTVTTIGKYAFTDATGLISMGNDNISEIIIPDSVTTIEDRAFFANRYLRKVTIPSSVTSIGSQAFGCCAKLYQVRNLSAVEIKLDSEMDATLCEIITDSTSQFKSKFEDNGKCVTYTKDGITYIIGTSGPEVTTIKADDVPDSATVIAKSAFFHEDLLESFEVPKQVTKICEHAFYSDNDTFLTNLKIVTFEEGSQITNIGARIFDGCGQLTQVTFNDIQSTSITFDSEWIGSPVGDFVLTLPTNIKLVSGSDTFINGSDKSLLAGKTWTVTNV